MGSTGWGYICKNWNGVPEDWKLHNYSQVRNPTVGGWRKSCWKIAWSHEKDEGGGEGGGVIHFGLNPSFIQV
jgi:hypothetical protein